MVLGIGEGVPRGQVKPAGPHTRHPVGTVRAARNPLARPRPRPGSRHRPVGAGWAASSGNSLGPPVGVGLLAWDPVAASTTTRAARRSGPGQAGRSGGAATPGLTSSIGAAGRLPPVAAGRRGIPSRSISWSCTETTAFAAAIRSSAGADPSHARSPRSAAMRRRRRTI